MILIRLLSNPIFTGSVIFTVIAIIFKKIVKTKKY